jgi:hypothetical protein
MKPQIQCGMYLCKIVVTSHITIILAILLCRYETWFLTFREEYELEVFESRVLQKIFGCNRELEVLITQSCKEVPRQYRMKGVVMPDALFSLVLSHNNKLFSS